MSITGKYTKRGGCDDNTITGSFAATRLGPIPQMCSNCSDTTATHQFDQPILHIVLGNPESRSGSVFGDVRCSDKVLSPCHEDRFWQLERCNKVKVPFAYLVWASNHSCGFVGLPL